VIGSDGEQAGIMSSRDAFAMAQEEGLDLVEISPNSDPPVCKVMDYGKYKFQQAKKAKDAKTKQKQIQVKEVKFKPRIDEHDYQFKCNHIRRFIAHGDKVRAFVHFRGREVTHREIGMRILNRIIEDLGETIVVEKRPSMEGHQMAMYLIGTDSGKSKPPAPKPARDSKKEQNAGKPSEEK
jgi:translation initiation factor IF-3